ncbi:MAG: hypothetical protein O2923_03135 [Verrucomicrobia bacterium]|nr:hypothetical protein [Verrucomicrobiota bacterium]MDA1088550.1 hypothetical protein [Verrucomicrobiota bacterium]
MLNRFLRDEKGQAVVEASIGLSLLTLLFMLLLIFGLQMINRLGTLQAARHAAWIRGNGLGFLLTSEPYQEYFASSFFGEPYNIAKVPSVVMEPVTPTPANPMGGNVAVSIVNYGMLHAEIEDAGAAAPFPFALMLTELPIVGKVFPEEADMAISMMESRAAWMDVFNSWEGWSSLVFGGPMLGGEIVVSQIFKQIGDLGGDVPDLP